MGNDMLSNHWVALCGRLLIPDTASRHMWHTLTEMYSEDHRQYHTFSHIGHMLALLLENSSSLSSLDSVVAAAFFHDSVYQPSSSTNEAASAEFAADFLKTHHVNSEIIGHVHDLILATSSHLSARLCGDAEWFLDADLAILGSEWEEYAAYAHAIREEFSCVSDVAFKAGRSAFLESFLSADRIFRTAVFSKQFEEQARSNLQQELLTLNRL